MIITTVWAIFVLQFHDVKYISRPKIYLGDLNACTDDNSPSWHIMLQDYACVISNRVNITFPVDGCVKKLFDSNFSSSPADGS